ncbi:MAG: trans-sulfuration enzyme family protein [Bacteroidota bacterium]
MGFSTDAIHAGQVPDLATGAVITPIYQTTTYAQEELGHNKGYTYGRTHNLTRAALEKNVAVLENGKYGIAFSSGLAAINAITGLVKAGDHIIAARNIYGGTYRLFEKIAANYGLSFSWVDMDDMEQLRQAVRPNTRIVFVETPTNPLLTLIDLKKTAEVCREYGLISIVDNTFMSPYFQKPLNFGCDIVVHSTTKYINGHSDVIGGLLVMNDYRLYERLKFMQNAAGAVPSPFDCWLVLRSTKTLAVRMDRHNQNALAVAGYLETSGLLERVIYPGLVSHPQHSLAKEQMTGFGGIVSIDTGDIERTKNLLKKVRVFTLAESLGGVESLICHPATMTHASVPREERMSFGLTDSLIRLSVGIEDAEDLIEDLTQALK